MVPWIHLLDIVVLELAAQGYNDLAAIAAFLVSTLGNPLTWFVIAAYFYWKGQRRRAFHMILLTMIASVLSGTLKNFFQRPRPSMDGLIKFPSSLGKATEFFSKYSLPSGHSTIMGAFYGFFRRQVSKKQNIILFIALIAVGIARLYLQVHYLTDVLAGMLLGLFLGEIVFHVEKRFGEELHSLEYPHGKVGLVLICIVLIVAILAHMPLVAMTPLGFFLGHFYSMHRKKHKTEFVWRKEIVGFGGLGAIGLSGIYAPPIAQEALFFILGLWVTLLYPRIYNRFMTSFRA